MATRTLVIGDIHGCLAKFDALLQSVAPTRDDHLVLLGDYIDRGPDSAGVLRRILELSRKRRLTAIRGNHEEMMLAAHASPLELARWLRNGGTATLRSYGGPHATIGDVSANHWQFLEHQLLDYLESPTHIFVHANVHPDRAMSKQSAYMLRWERCDNIAAHKSGKVIVCGHTRQKNGRPLNKGFAICIDTNAVGGGPLTCLDAGSGRIWQAQAGGRVQQGIIADFLED